MALEITKRGYKDRFDSFVSGQLARYGLSSSGSPKVKRADAKALVDDFSRFVTIESLRLSAKDQSGPLDGPAQGIDKAKRLLAQNTGEYLPPGDDADLLSHLRPAVLVLDALEKGAKPGTRIYVPPETKAKIAGAAAAGGLALLLWGLA